MKLETVILLENKVNDISLKSKQSINTEQFLDLFESKITEGDNVLETEEDESIEDIILEFLEMILSNSAQKNEQDNKKINEHAYQSIENTKGDHTKNIFNKEIFNDYFQGNITENDLIQNLMQDKKIKDIVNNNKIDESLIEKILAKNITEKLTNKILVDNINVNEEEINEPLNQEENKLEFSYKKLSSKNDFLNESYNDKEISILKDIAKDSNSKNFMINQSIPNSKNLNVNQVETTKPYTIRENFFTQDIVRTINYLKTNGLQELKINLSPKELGDMSIKLIKNDKETKVLITLAKDDVFNLINKHIQEINKHLNELNIKVKEIDIEIDNNNQNFFSDNLNQQYDKDKRDNQHKKRSKESRGTIKSIENESTNHKKIRTINDENINLLA